MRKLLLAAAAVLLTGPAYASDVTDMTAVIAKYAVAFDATLCTKDAIIIDDFAPHAWQGKTTCADWAAALTAYDKSEGNSGGKVTPGKAWHADVTGDRGYAVYPTDYAYTHKGKKVAEKGVWTFAMQKTADGWRIAGWAWAKH